MRGHDLTQQRRILDARAERRAYVDQLCATHNLCAWCREARVEPGQPLCLRCAHFVSLDDLTAPA